MDIKKVESDVLRILSAYTPHMDNTELSDLIKRAESLNLDQLKIHLYEQKQDFDK